MSDAICWQHGRDLLLVREGGGRFCFPDRCVVCNAPANGRVRKTLYHLRHWWIPFLSLAMHIHVRRRVEVEFGLCRQHALARRIGWACIATAVVLPAALLPAMDGIAVVVACFVALALLFPIGVRLATVMRLVACDPMFARLRVGRKFLESLPTSSEEA